MYSKTPPSRNFNIKQYVLPVKTFSKEITYDRRYLYDEYVIQHDYQFIFGGTYKTETKSYQSHPHTYYTPKTIYDSVKELLIKFDQTLNFGWLKPEYEKHTILTHNNITNKFINVVPLEEFTTDQNKVLFLLKEPQTHVPTNYYADC
jgi:hypothetical protein